MQCRPLLSMGLLTLGQHRKSFRFLVLPKITDAARSIGIVCQLFSPYKPMNPVISIRQKTFNIINLSNMGIMTAQSSETF